MDNVLETLKLLGPVRLAVMGAILLGLLLFFTLISLRMTTPQMELLYADLSTVDSSAVAAKLEENAVAYKVSPDGTRIHASEDDIGRARMLLAEAGLPNGGSLGYEIFDQTSGFGTTNFVQNINQVRALEGELSRTIMSLHGIRSARVHLVLPERELFSREKRTASASVFLGLTGKTAPKEETISAIQSLIASAVPDLSAENVAIIDNNGNLLASSEGNTVNRTSAKIEEMRLGHESRLIRKIEDQIGRIVGYGKVRATVTAEMNFDRVSLNEERFDPNGQVVRSTQVTEESSLARTANGNADDIGIINNLPNAAAEAITDADVPSEEDSRVEELTNYEISRTTRSTVKEIGEVKRLSVAVLVDGRYTKNTDAGKTYEPRSAQELEKIKALVRTAVGFDEKRGDQIEVVNLQFAQIDTDEDALANDMLLGFEKNKILDMAEMLTLTLMVILVITLVLQPMVQKLMDAASFQTPDALSTDLLAATPQPAALTGPHTHQLAGALPSSASGDLQSATAGAPSDDDDIMVDLHAVDSKVKISSLKKIEEIVDNYPTETLSVLRGWMSQSS